MLAVHGIYSIGDLGPLDDVSKAVECPVVRSAQL